MVVAPFVLNGSVNGKFHIVQAVVDHKNIMYSSFVSIRNSSRYGSELLHLIR